MKIISKITLREKPEWQVFSESRSEQWYIDSWGLSLRWLGLKITSRNGVTQVGSKTYFIAVCTKVCARAKLIKICIFRGWALFTPYLNNQRLPTYYFSISGFYSSIPIPQCSLYAEKPCNYNFLLETLIWDCASPWGISWSKSTNVKMDISVGPHCTVRSAKIIKEIGLVFPENEETWQGLHHTLASLTSLQFSSISTLKFKGRYISYNLRKIIPTQGWSGWHFSSPSWGGITHVFCELEVWS